MNKKEFEIIEKMWKEASPLSMKTSIRSGMLLLEADRDDRFSCKIKDMDLNLNYIRSTSFNRIKIARRIAIGFSQDGLIEKRILTEKLGGSIIPNRALLHQNIYWTLVRMTAFSDSKEDELRFNVLSITPHPDEIWQPNRITAEADIFMEVIELEINTEILKK